MIKEIIFRKGGWIKSQGKNYIWVLSFVENKVVKREIMFFYIFDSRIRVLIIIGMDDILVFLLYVIYFRIDIVGFKRKMLVQYILGYIYCFQYKIFSIF